MILLYSIFTAPKEESASYIFLEYFGAEVTTKSCTASKICIIHYFPLSLLFKHRFPEEMATSK